MARFVSPTSGRLPGETDSEFAQRIERLATAIPIVISACFRNKCVQDLIDDERYPHCSYESFRESPVVRVDYEEAFAVAPIIDGLSATRRKKWGDGPWILPLSVHDYVDPFFVTYHYKANSKRRQRYEQRERLKELLGKQHRKLVRIAQRNTKQRFFESVNDEQTQVIELRTTLDATRFWRACRGTHFYELPPREVQRLLFEL